MSGEARQRVCRCERAQVAAIEPGSAGEVFGRCEWAFLASIHEALGGIELETFDEAQAEPECRTLSPALSQGRGGTALCQGKGRTSFQSAFYIAQPHVGGTKLDAVAARVLHDRGSRVEAERLAVQKRARESRRLVALDPARHVHQQREAGGMRLREAVFAEALD